MPCNHKSHFEPHWWSNHCKMCIFHWFPGYADQDRTQSPRSLHIGEKKIYQQFFLWSVLRERQKLQVLAELGAEGSVDNFVNLETQHPHMPVLHQKNVNVDKILAKVQATLPSLYICIFSFLHSRYCKNFWAVLLFCPSSGYSYSLTRILVNSIIV